MLTYRQILDAKVETVQTQIDGWKTVNTKLATTKKNAAGVRKSIRDSDWEGQSEKAADGKADFLNSQVSAAKDEAKAIRLILWQAKHLFNEVQTLLKDLSKEVGENPYLKIDDQGKVDIDMSGTNAFAFAGGHGGTLILQLAKMAEKYNGDIKKLCELITTVDDDVDKALRAASNVDDKSDPNFNPDALKDGHISLDKYLYDRYELAKEYSEDDLIENKYTNGKRTPAEVLAMALMFFDRDKVQNAHDVATEYGYEEEKNDPGGFHNGRGDALKHALLSAMLTRDVGEGNARNLLDGHEMMPNNPVNEEVMDRHNNEIGYRLAREHPNATNEELATMIRKEIDAGNTLTIDKKTKEIEYTGEPD